MAGHWRDECSDIGRGTDGSKVLRGRDLTVSQDFGPTSIAEQNALGGFNKTDLPVGGPHNRQRYTVGSAEAE